jgi:hypothetical protein
MPDPRANVSSVEAIENFRTNLILFVSKVRPLLEGVSSDVLRLKLWLQDEQRIHWEGELRRRRKILETAQAALSTAQLAKFKDASYTEKSVVQRAREQVEEAEGKIKLLKFWDRNFETKVQPTVKALDKLSTFFSHDLSKAAAYLESVVTTLDDYAAARKAGLSSTGRSEDAGERKTK